MKKKSTKVSDVKNPYKYRTYSLSVESIKILEDLADQFGERLHTRMPITRLLDSLIKHCADVTFEDIVNKDL